MPEAKVAEKTTQQTTIDDSLLNQAIAATRKTERPQAELLLRTFTENALSGTLRWDRNLSKTVDMAIQRIDELLSQQITEILHAPKFQKLEGSWRGLHYLIKNSVTGNDLKFRVLNVDKKMLIRDLEKASEFDQSTLFKKLYEEEYGTPGGEPYSALIGDYEIDNTAQDMTFLRNISGVAAAAFCPFIAAAGPGIMGLDSWEELSKPKDLNKVFSSSEYLRWNGYRETEDSRFVSLVLPRTLAREPYGDSGHQIDGFDFQELELTEEGKAKKIDHSKYTWMNTAYVMGARMTDAFHEYGWCTAIRGAEGGGKVTNLHTHSFISDDGDIDMKCPTEIGITDRREAELSNQGFLPLCHYKNTDYAVFFGGQTTCAPKQFEDSNATADAEVAARLPFIMATSRVAHYLKVMARDKIGSFKTIGEVETWLNNWIIDYVNSNPATSQKFKARFPFANAKVEVKEVPGKPGSYNAIAWLQPWLQLEELNTSLRLVARIPEKG